MNTKTRFFVLLSAVASAFVLTVALAKAAAPSAADSIQLSKSAKEADRIQAVDQLGSPGPQSAEAVATLTALLKDSSATVRAHAAGSLGKIGSPAKPAAADLAALLKDSDDKVRRQSVKALIAIRPGPKVMIPLFIKLMEDADPGVHARVLNAVTDAGEAAVPGLIEALKNDKVAYWVCVVLRGMGPTAKAAVPALAAKLNDPRPDIRREAVLALGAMGDAALPAVPQIVATLDDEHAGPAATFVLGQLGKIPADAEQKIRANAKSDDKNRSTASLWALARVHPEDKDLRRQFTEQAVERLKDQDPFVRVVAARALAALPPAPEITLPIWEKAMKDADATTAHYALDALATLGAPAVPRLIDLLEKHKDLRIHVVYTLGQMGPAAAPATDALAKLVADEDVNLATEAILALGKIGPAAKSAVPALSAALQQKESPNARAIVLALGDIGPQAAAAEPLVLKALESKDGSLAVLAASALLDIDARSPKAIAKALPVLTACLSDPLPETRKAAADTLGELGPSAREAAPLLQKAMKDDAKSVREAAEKALNAVK